MINIVIDYEPQTKIINVLPPTCGEILFLASFQTASLHKVVLRNQGKSSETNQRQLKSQILVLQK